MFICLAGTVFWQRIDTNQDESSLGCIPRPLALPCSYTSCHRHPSQVQKQPCHQWYHFWNQTRTLFPNYHRLMRKNRSEFWEAHRSMHVSFETVNLLKWTLRFSSTTSSNPAETRIGLSLRAIRGSWPRFSTILHTATLIVNTYEILL